MHTRQAQSFGLCRILGLFYQIGPHTQLLTNNLPVTYQLLGSQNLEPVTKQAPETQPFSKFRNPQLVVNPSLSLGTVPFSSGCDLSHCRCDKLFSPFSSLTRRTHVCRPRQLSLSQLLYAMLPELDARTHPCCATKRPNDDLDSGGPLGHDPDRNDGKRAKPFARDGDPPHLCEAEKAQTTR